jgi:RNA polymerase sigma factor (sigma-70 family)
MCDAMEAFMAEGKCTILLTDEETRELARRVRAGDRSAVNELVEHNRPLVTSLARRVLGSRYNADDFLDDVQDGMVALWRAAENYDPDHGTKARFSSYATLVVVRRLLAKNRRRVARRDAMVTVTFRCSDHYDEEGFASGVFNEPMEESEDEILSEVSDAVNDLPDDERRLVRQHYYEGRNLEDIGREIGVSHTTAWKRIRRGVAKVREAVMA